MKQIDFLIQNFLTFLMLPIIKAGFDQGFFNQSCHPINQNFICSNSTPYIFTIQFKQPFDNIPQIFLVLEHLGVSVKTDFRIEIIETNKLSFTLKIACLKNSADCVMMSWFALDDQRFQIINSFNNENFTTQTYLHKNKNVNCEIGIISLISHNFEELNFNLHIDKITADNVTVSLKKHPEDFSKLFQIGFQIMLGPKEAFLDFKFLESISNYSKILQHQNNSWFLTPYTGMGYPYTDAFRLKKVQVNVSNSQFNFSLNGYDNTLPLCNHSYGFILHNLKTKFYSLNLSKLDGIQRTYQLCPKSICFRILEIQYEINPIDELSLTVDKAFTEINISIEIPCPLNKYLQSTFYVCHSCSIQKSIQTNNQCGDSLKELAFKVKYIQQPQTYQELKIKLQKDLFQLNQILYNQQIEEFEVFKITLTDIEK